MFIIEKTTSTILEWYTHYKKDNIDFNPPYQRVGGIWTTGNKQLLIDSIYNKLDIPKFYVNYFVSKGNPLNPKEKLYAIVDGKQRFHAIFEFMEDEFPLNNTFEFIGNTEIDIKGLKYSEISMLYPTLKHEFDNYKIDIVLVITDEQERIDELFLRLNEGKQLNNAEKRYAISGDLSKEMKKMVETNFLFKKLSFTDKRYDYFDVITKLFLLESKKEIISLSKSNLDNLLKDNRVITEETKEDLKAFKIKIDIFSELFKDNDPILNSKSKIPLYYLFINQLEEYEKKSSYKFLVEFEKLILNNRLSNDIKDETLIEYDRLTQQGTISKSSLESRLNILNRYFDYYKQNNFQMAVVKVSVEFDD